MPIIKNLIVILHTHDTTLLNPFIVLKLQNLQGLCNLLDTYAILHRITDLLANLAHTKPICQYQQHHHSKNPRLIFPSHYYCVSDQHI